jgi:hypothetical protein
MAKYHAIWQDYERYDNPAPINIRLNAVNNEEALKKIFIRKVAMWWSVSLAAYLEENGIVEADLTEEYLVNYFDNIDIGGDSFLIKLVNLDTDEVVYSIGELDEGTDEVWED